MDISQWREKLSGISYHEWQRLRFLVDRELDLKIAEDKRQLALGQPDEATELFMHIGLKER